MTTRQEFHEATVHLGFSYAMDYHDEEFNSVHTEKAYQAWCIATSRQEAKIKALVDAAELVIAWYEAEDDHAKEPDFYKRIAMCRASEDALRSAIALAKETL